MRIAGINIIGNDHALAFWDTKTDERFAISLERVTRIKHDNKGLAQIRKEYPEYFHDIDMVCIGSYGDDGQTIKMNKSLTYTLNLRNFLYEVLRPRYISEQRKQLEEISKNPLKLGFVNSGIAAILYLASNMSSNKNHHISVEKYLKKLFVGCSDFRFYNHQDAHCASSYFTSPFVGKEKVLTVSLDGFGDGLFSKAMVINDEGNLKPVRESKTTVIANASTTFKVFSLGILYANFTEAMGLQINSEEGKVEALAAYGDHDSKLFEELCESVIIEGGEIRCKPSIQKFYDLDWLIEKRKELKAENFCAVIQKFLDIKMTEYLTQLKSISGCKRLCLSGGVVANVIANMHLYEETLFDEIFVVPAMADDGTALGALTLGASECSLPNPSFAKGSMPYWGPVICKSDVETELQLFNEKLNFVMLPNWQGEVAKRISEGEIGALVQGNMEFGPRALGNRSIIASPTFADMIDKINGSIKKRPKYQPFCPSCLEEERERLFSISYSNKHMTAAFRLKPNFQSDLPGACHVDLTARPQFVTELDNSNYYKLLLEVKKLCGYGVLINTSFNKHGRTIVRTANDAIIDFIDCKLNFMILDKYLITRNSVPNSRR